MQQYKLFPVLAFAYAAWFAKEDLQKFFNEIYQNEISKGDFKNVGEVSYNAFEMLSFSVNFLKTEI